MIALPTDQAPTSIGRMSARPVRSPAVKGRKQPSDDVAGIQRTRLCRRKTRRGRIQPLPRSGRSGGARPRRADGPAGWSLDVPGHFDMRPARSATWPVADCWSGSIFRKAWTRSCRTNSCRRPPSACMAACASPIPTFRHVAKWPTIS